MWERLNKDQPAHYTLQPHTLRLTPGTFSALVRCLLAPQYIQSHRDCRVMTSCGDLKVETFAHWRPLPDLPELPDDAALVLSEKGAGIALIELTMTTPPAVGFDEIRAYFQRLSPLVEALAEPVIRASATPQRAHAPWDF